MQHFHAGVRWIDIRHMTAKPVPLTLENTSENVIVCPACEQRKWFGAFKGTRNSVMVKLKHTEKL